VVAEMQAFVNGVRLHEVRNLASRSARASTSVKSEVMSSSRWTPVVESTSRRASHGLAGEGSPAVPAWAREAVMRRISMAIAGLVAVALATAGPVAASPLAASIGSPSLSQSRVVITVPVSVVCGPLDPSFDLVIQTIEVHALQAAGKSIARGSGTAHGVLFSGTDTLLFPCDGNSHSVPVSLTADPTGPPFHGGIASFTAFVQVDEGIEAFPGCGCGSIFVTETANAGPVDRKMR
jgi:hypothetical protein